MRTLRTKLLTAAAGTLVATGAVAADLGGPPPRSLKDAPYLPPYTFSWTGLYVGAHIGYGWSDVDWQGGARDGSGALAGAQIGYLWQSGALVWGVEADASSSWVDGGGHDINWLASVRGRLGAAINNNRTLLYATAGGAWADADYAAAGFGTLSDTHFGWVAGGGIEHMLAPNVTARVEYLYYGFDSITAPAGVLGAGATTVDPSVQTVRFGLNFKF
ncbi:MAG: porin family protein [Hyphomicrobiaceae bacterium]|nr:MAG: porin family protein [Hyphomicrobiaceae bacterium]